MKSMRSQNYHVYDLTSVPFNVRSVYDLITIGRKHPKKKDRERQREKEIERDREKKRQREKEIERERDRERKRQREKKKQGGRERYFVSKNSVTKTKTFFSKKIF